MPWHLWRGPYKDKKWVYPKFPEKSTHFLELIEYIPPTLHFYVKHLPNKNYCHILNPGCLSLRGHLCSAYGVDFYSINYFHVISWLTLEFFPALSQGLSLLQQKYLIFIEHFVILPGMGLIAVHMLCYLIFTTTLCKGTIILFYNNNKKQYNNNYNKNPGDLGKLNNICCYKLAELDITRWKEFWCDNSFKKEKPRLRTPARGFLKVI